METGEGMTTQPTDPFAKGTKLRCVKSAYGLTVGCTYESIESCDRTQTVKVHYDGGDAGYYFRYLFEPVPAAGEGCAACGAAGASRSRAGALYNGEHLLCRDCWMGDNGLCEKINADIARRSAPPQPEQAKVSADCSLCGDTWQGGSLNERDECPNCVEDGVTPFDPYANHRLCKPDETARKMIDDTDVRSGRRDRLVAALKAEHDASSKRSGLLETFPRQGRNFALRNPR